MTDFTVTLSGTIGGLMWMPCAPGSMPFKQDFSPTPGPFVAEWCGLRDAVLHVCRCGDFRNTGIVRATIKVTYMRGNKYIVKVKELNPCKEIEDCFADAEIIEAIECGGYGDY